MSWSRICLQHQSGITRPVN